ncbi:DUF4232 domain-containing protein [Yinghuangia sp. ASG 101]|uniref:DUF4232 domain-containing protein n=1 Tax=Yinghuangia sp. ASG 101 TaxID=2896848 RepID=UPI001E5246AF|nr:DUF4232 domain-containing protein [Yinghuangia sp. ASG 101]UGQ11908.1 DUF4232 domain-containing protein [Yinghuangia sp. ASG 101]
MSERHNVTGKSMEIPMRSHRTNRSARVALAVTATVALAAGLTACNSDDDDTAAAGASSAQSPAAGNGGSGAPVEGSPAASAANTGGTTSSTGTTTGGSGSSGGSGTSGGSGGSGGSSQGSGGAGNSDSGVGQSCGTNDLDFLVTPSDSGGYLLVTATAQPGITCYLDGGAPLVLFSSAEKTKPYPSELMASPAPDSVKVTGSTHAYAVLIPNTTRADSAVEFAQADITVAAADPHTAHVTLPGTFGVDEAAVTSWYTTAKAATPNAN